MQLEEVQTLCLFIKSSAVNPDSVASFRGRGAVEIDFPMLLLEYMANSLMAEKQD